MIYKKKKKIINKQNNEYCKNSLNQLKLALSREKFVEPIEI